MTRYETDHHSHASGGASACGPSRPAATGRPGARCVARLERRSSTLAWMPTRDASADRRATKRESEAFCAVWTACECVWYPQGTYHAGLSSANLAADGAAFCANVPIPCQSGASSCRCLQPATVPRVAPSNRSFRCMRARLSGHVSPVGPVGPVVRGVGARRPEKAGESRSPLSGMCLKLPHVAARSTL